MFLHVAPLTQDNSGPSAAHSSTSSSQKSPNQYSVHAHKADPSSGSTEQMPPFSQGRERQSDDTGCSHLSPVNPGKKEEFEPSSNFNSNPSTCFGLLNTVCFQREVFPTRIEATFGVKIHLKSRLSVEAVLRHEPQIHFRNKFISRGLYWKQCGICG